MTQTCHITMINDIATTIIDVVKGIIKTAMRLPFQVWYAIPLPIKYIIAAMLVILMIVIVVTLIKNRNEIINSLY